MVIKNILNLLNHKKTLDNEQRKQLKSELKKMSPEGLELLQNTIEVAFELEGIDNTERF